MKVVRSLLVLAFAFTTVSTFAWDYEGHRWVNQLALQSLPKDFPSFVRTPEAAERIAFLSGEPDRWRNSPDLPLKHCNAPDHFFDLEYVKDHGIDIESLTHFRYEFVAQLAAGRAKHSDKVEAVDPAKNSDRTRELIGFLPWTITEYYGKLKSGFSYLQAFEEAGTPEEITNAQQNIIYVMGVMGHFLGDAAQPLHSTKHFNGWVGENPKGYSTRKTFHSWIDGGFIGRSGIQYADLSPRIKTAQMVWPGDPKAKHPDVFPETMAFFIKQHKMVEPLYILEKNNKLDGKNPSDEGREFIINQIVAGGQMLGNLWYSAWQQATPDTYLRARLLDRQTKQADGKK
ncbi:MAG: hypothetical protein H0X66_05870 [Verrucomicrobia bacterium]|nr:hypothetical protein [Verrucomicrobiota bacterium]